MHFYPIILIFLQLLSSCSTQSQNYVHTLNNEAEFLALQREPLSSKYAEVKAVKLVYELATENIYFLSDRYNYHHEFCIQELHCKDPLAVFNRNNYGSNTDDHRSYLLANLNYHSGLDLYFMDLSASDKMSLDDIEFLWTEIVKTTFCDEKLALLLNSSRLVEAAKNWDTSLELVSPEYIYANQNFQAVSCYEKVGFLKKVEIDSLDSTAISQEDIVLINGTPLYLAGVSGAITTDIQTPLSHLSILGKHRKVPVMALKDAWKNQAINDLVGKWVLLKVTPEGYEISESQAPKPGKDKQKRKSLKRDLSIKEVVDVSDFDRKTSNSCGYKAENFGILYQLSLEHDFSVPESAFGIPFYFYQEHADASGAQTLINKLYFAENPSHLLNSIKERIMNEPVAPELLAAVEQKIRSSGDFTRMRFRSSTNAEDMKGFSGAGLYDSKTGELGNEKKSIDRAIKTVWASLWNEAAYKERAYFNLKQEESAMGILVHRSFTDEEVNGVAITCNIYRPNNLGFVVNAQLGEESVVQPDPNITCDQVVCYPSNNAGFYSENPTIEIITSSSLNNHELVMTKEELIHLADMLEVIKKFFYYRDFTTKTYAEYGLDLEFKLDAVTRKLYFKQVRPFN